MAPPPKQNQEQQDQAPQLVNQNQQTEDEQEESSNARKVSNASLLARHRKHRELGASAHIAAGEASFGTAEDGLEVLARQFYDWSVTFNGIANNHVETDAGKSPEEDTVRTTIVTATNTAARVSNLVGVLEPERKASLSPSVGKVQGSFSSFSQTIIALAKNRQIKVSIDELTKKIADLSKDMNAKVVDAEMHNPTKKSSQPIDKALLASAGKHLISLESDLASVEAGNWDDAHRINIHAVSLADLSETKGLDLTAHRPQIEQLSARIEQLLPRSKGRLQDATASMKRILAP